MLVARRGCRWNTKVEDRYFIGKFGGSLENTKVEDRYFIGAFGGSLENWRSNRDRCLIGLLERRCLWINCEDKLFCEDIWLLEFIVHNWCTAVAGYFFQVTIKAALHLQAFFLFSYVLFPRIFYVLFLPFTFVVDYLYLCWFGRLSIENRLRFPSRHWHLDL